MTTIYIEAGETSFDLSSWMIRCFGQSNRLMTQTPVQTKTKLQQFNGLNWRQVICVDIIRLCTNEKRNAFKNVQLSILWLCFYMIVIIRRVFVDERQLRSRKIEIKLLYIERIGCMHLYAEIVRFFKSHVSQTLGHVFASHDRGHQTHQTSSRTSFCWRLLFFEPYEQIPINLLINEMV